ncbi:MAG: alpha/beta hydrolase [Hyphomicrobiaceae bacterium]|nr:MAG: alpha/beta hydrolase [Hyphomicrobiaceae bacterium]
MTVNPIEEKNYNNRAAVPEHPRHFASWRERGEAFRAIANGRLDIAYGPEPKARLDFFPAAKPNAPLHVFIHGGYWQALDKAEQSFVARSLTEDGVCVALVNYSLCPDVTLDAIVAEVRQGILWLARNAEGLGASARGLTVSGHSAGGHLVAMLMATDWTAAGAADPIKAGVAVSGVFELAPLINTSINQKVGIDEAVAARLSPSRLKPTTRAPLLLAVGEKESQGGFHWQADELIYRWRDLGPRLERLTVAGADHFTILEGYADRTSPFYRRLLALARGL